MECIRRQHFIHNYCHYLWLSTSIIIQSLFSSVVGRCIFVINFSATRNDSLFFGLKSEIFNIPYDLKPVYSIIFLCYFNIHYSVWTPGPSHEFMIRFPELLLTFFQVESSQAAIAVKGESFIAYHCTFVIKIIKKEATENILNSVHHKS